MNNFVDINYMWGLFESDGNFSIIFSKDKTMTLGYKVRPEFQITQKNVLLLKKLQNTLFTLGVTSRIKTYPLNKNKRASCLVSEGISNIEKILQNKQNLKITFYSIKEIDFQIMVFLIKMTKQEQNNHNSEIGRKTIIDLKFCLHQPPKLPDDVFICFQKYIPRSKVLYIRKNHVFTHIKIPTSNRHSRSILEEQHGFSKNSSLDLSNKIISSIHEQYFQTIQKTVLFLEKKKQKQEQNPLTINPYYIAGLIDGDGFISKKGISFHFEQGSELLYLVIGSFFGDYNLNIYQVRNKNSTTMQLVHSSILEKAFNVLQESCFEIKGAKFALLIKEKQRINFKRKKYSLNHYVKGGIIN